MSTLCLEKGKKIHLFLVCKKSKTTATRPKKINVLSSGSRPLAPEGDVFIIPDEILLILFRLNLKLYILNKLSLLMANADTHSCFLLNLCIIFCSYLRL